MLSVIFLIMERSDLPLYCEKEFWEEMEGMQPKEIY